MQSREFHGGSAFATHSDYPQCHLSRPVSACSNSAVAPLIWRDWDPDRGRKGCLISPLQIACMRSACFSVFIGCTEFGIGFKYGQIFQKSMKSTKWRWTSYAIKRISWRLGFRHTQRLSSMPLISACVSLQQQCSCAIDLERLRPRQRQKRLFDLAASDSLHETGLFFRVHRLHWVWKWVQVWPDLSKEHEKHKVEMDIVCNQENFMEARLSPNTATMLNAIYLSLCSNRALRPLVWTAWESDRGRVGTLQWTSEIPAFDLGFQTFALGYDRSL